MSEPKKKLERKVRPKQLPWTSRKSGDAPGVVMRTPRMNRKKAR